MVALADTPAEDHALTFAFGMLGAIYGFVAISVLTFIVLPRLIAGQTASAVVEAGRPTAVGASRVVQAARPLPVRWSPVYDGGYVAHNPPGAYLPARNAIELQPMPRLPAAANVRFPPVNRVSLRLFVLHVCMWLDGPSGYGAGLAINRSRVQIPVAALLSATQGTEQFGTGRTGQLVVKSEVLASHST